MVTPAPGNRHRGVHPRARQPVDPGRAPPASGARLLPRPYRRRGGPGRGATAARVPRRVAPPGDGVGRSPDRGRGSIRAAWRSRGLRVPLTCPLRAHFPPPPTAWEATRKQQASRADEHPGAQALAPQSLPWRPREDSRAAFGCEALAQLLLGREPLTSGLGNCAGWG